MQRTTGIILLILMLTGFSYAQHFESVDPTGLPYIILIEQAMLYHTNLLTGDEIAVFDGELCVGSLVIEETITPDTPMSLVAWAGASLGDIILPGYTDGHEMTIRMWQNIEDNELEPDIDFVEGDGTFGDEVFSVVRLIAGIRTRVSGAVTECSEDGIPLSNVAVFLDQIPTPVDSTNDQGEYFILYVDPDQDHTISFEHPLYDLVAVPNVQVPNQEPFETDLDVILRKPDAEIPEDPIEMTVFIIGTDSDSTSSTDFDLISSGCADLNWSLSILEPVPDWLTIEPMEGLLDEGSTQNISITADFSAADFPLEDGMDYNVQVQFQGTWWENPPTLDLVVHLVNHIQDESVIIPNSYRLDQNFPNPFNPVTEISFNIAKSEHVLLTVSNLLGQEVARLVDGPLEAGRHEVEFEASNLPSGIFIYKLQTSNYQESRKMILVK